MKDPMKYRKKPVIVDAIQFDGTWHCMGHIAAVFEATDKIASSRAGMSIKTRWGEMQAEPEDWVVKDTSGELYAVKPILFEELYELIVDD